MEEGRRTEQIDDKGGHIYTHFVDGDNVFRRVLDFFSKKYSLNEQQQIDLMVAAVRSSLRAKISREIFMKINSSDVGISNQEEVLLGVNTSDGSQMLYPEISQFNAEYLKVLKLILDKKSYEYLEKVLSDIESMKLDMQLSGDIKDLTVDNIIALNKDAINNIFDSMLLRNLLNFIGTVLLLFTEFVGAPIAFLHFQENAGKLFILFFVSILITLLFSTRFPGRHFKYKNFGREIRGKFLNSPDIKSSEFSHLLTQLVCMRASDLDSVRVPELEMEVISAFDRFMNGFSIADASKPETGEPLDFAVKLDSATEEGLRYDLEGEVDLGDKSLQVEDSLENVSATVSVNQN